MTDLLSLPSEILLDGLVARLDPLTQLLLSSTCQILRDLIPLKSKMIRAGTFQQNRIIQKAACLGYKEIILWARAQGCRWSSSTCSIAARAGQFNLLKWLHKEGCPWDESTCSSALLGGHIKICNWALENGCRH